MHEATGDGTASVSIVGTCQTNLSDNGAVATVTAAPNANSSFVGWTVTLGGCAGTTSPCSVGPLGGGQNNLAATFRANTTTTISNASALASTPTALGASYAVNVTVTRTGSSTTNVTGTVNVSDGTDSCSITLTAGQPTASGTCNLVSTTAGSKTITATYAGSANYDGSSGTATHTVNKASTTTSITSDLPDPTVVGQPYSIAVSVARIGSTGQPIGTVTVSDGTATCLATVAGSGGTSTGSCSLTSTTAGAKALTASYGGDSNFNASTTAASTPHQVSKANTSTTITSDLPDPSVVGQPVAIAFSVTVTGLGAGTPTGTVTVSDADSLQTCTASVATGSCQIAFTAAGTHHLTATYAGDSNFNGSASTPATIHVVNKADTTITITSHLPDPSVVGQTYTVEWTVTVDAPGVGTPTGTVTVSDGTTGCVAAVEDGECTFASAASGAKTLTATYSGDANLNGDSDTEAHHVNKADTTITITEDNPDPSVVDQAYTVKWTVTVNAPGGGTPTGLVTVSDGDGNSCGAIPVATGQCTFSSSSSVPNIKTLTASYAGDTNFNGDSDTELHTVNPRHTSTVVNCVPAAIVVAEDTVCTVTVTDDDPAGTKTDPDGTVTFSLPDAIAPVDLGDFDPATADCTLDSDGILGTFTSSCQVTYTPSAKGDGTHTIAASYEGSDVHAASADTDGVSVTVDHRATTTSVVCASPVVVGQPSLCSATVDDASANGTKTAPSGSVAFTSDGSGTFTLPGASCTLVAADADTSTCQATYTPTARGTGTHNIGAAYDSDEDVHADSSDANGFDLIVNKADTTITITEDNPDPSVVDQAYTVKWTVTVNAPGGGTPTGLVTVSDGDGNSCGAIPVATGQCTFSSSSSVPNIKTLTATYAGDDELQRRLGHRAPHRQPAPHQHGRQLRAGRDRGRRGHRVHRDRDRRRPGGHQDRSRRDRDLQPARRDRAGRPG